jgi:hypothetical protein
MKHQGILIAILLFLLTFGFSNAASLRVRKKQLIINDMSNLKLKGPKILKYVAPITEKYTDIRKFLSFEKVVQKYE